MCRRDEKWQKKIIRFCFWTIIVVQSEAPSFILMVNARLASAIEFYYPLPGITLLLIQQYPTLWALLHTYQGHVYWSSGILLKQLRLPDSYSTFHFAIPGTYIRRIHFCRVLAVHLRIKQSPTPTIRIIFLVFYLLGCLILFRRAIWFTIFKYFLSMIHPSCILQYPITRVRNITES